MEEEKRQQYLKSKKRPPNLGVNSSSLKYIPPYIMATTQSSRGVDDIKIYFHWIILPLFSLNHKKSLKRSIIFLGSSQSFSLYFSLKRFKIIQEDNYVHSR